MNGFRELCKSKADMPLTPLNAVVLGMLDQGMSLEQATRIFQRVYVLRAGVAAAGHVSRTGSLLGVSRNTMTRLLKLLELPLSSPRLAKDKHLANRVMKARFSAAKRDVIRAEYSAGMTQLELAKIHGTCQTNISKIVRAA